MEVVKGVQAYMAWNLKWIKELQKIERTYNKSRWKFGYKKMSESEIDRQNEIHEDRYERHVKLLHSNTKEMRKNFRAVIEDEYQKCRAMRE